MHSSQDKGVGEWEPVYNVIERDMKGGSGSHFYTKRLVYLLPKAAARRGTRRAPSVRYQMKRCLTMKL